MDGFREWLSGLARQVQPPPERGATLITCAKCGFEAVVPVAWQDRGDKWWIAVRCGSCGARRTVTLDDDEAGEYGTALDRGVDAIARTFAALERRRLQAEIESLTIALERDLIGPDDFARRSYAS